MPRNPHATAQYESERITNNCPEHHISANEYLWDCPHACINCIRELIEENRELRASNAFMRRYGTIGTERIATETAIANDARPAFDYNYSYGSDGNLLIAPVLRRPQDVSYRVLLDPSQASVPGTQPEGVELAP